MLYHSWKGSYKKVLSFLLATLLCVGLLALPVSAESYSGTCGEHVTWNLNNGVMTISGSGAMEDYSQRNPAPWQDYADRIQILKVEDGVTTIGERAFYHCTKLTAVTLPNSVHTIGATAFADCYALRQINLPAVQTLGESCFYACTSLVNIVLPETLTRIEDQAFYRCKSLGGITIPQSVTYLGDSIFTYCDKLVYARILAPLSALPTWTFYGCDLLTEVYLPNSITKVEDKALSQCPELNYVVYTGSDDVKEDIEYQLHEEVVWPQGSSTKTEVTYQENPGSIITTTTNTPIGSNDLDPAQPGTTIDATVTDSSGWSDVTDAVKEELNRGNQPTVNIQVQTQEPIPDSALTELNNKNVNVNINTTENADWQVILQDQTNQTLQGAQDLTVSVKPMEESKFQDTLGESQAYEVTLGQTTMNSTLLIPLGTQTYNQVATLYAVDGKKLTKISSVIVDYDGKAAFSLAGTNAGEYIVALDVKDITSDEVMIPQKLAQQYDITYGATLTDSQGNQYVLTGRVNKLGIDLGDLTLIVVGVLVGSTVLIGVVMTIWNKQQKKYQRRRK